MEGMRGYKGFTERDRKMQRLKTEPRAYEYVKLPGLDRMMEAQRETERPGMGLLLLALLSSFTGVGEDFGNESGE